MRNFFAENRQLIVRRFGLIVIDILSVALATYLGLIARFDFDPAFVQGSVYGQTAWNYLPYSIAITIILFWAFPLYQSLWQYAGTPEIVNIFIACVLSAISQMVVVHMILKWTYPRSC